MKVYTTNGSIAVAVKCVDRINNQINQNLAFYLIGNNLNLQQKNAKYKKYKLTDVLNRIAYDEPVLLMYFFKRHAAVLSY